MDLEAKVLLLALYKKQSDETFNEVLFKLENSKVFTLKQGKKYLKELRVDGFVTETSLSIQGEVLAKQIENEFKI